MLGPSQVDVATMTSPCSSTRSDERQARLQIWVAGSKTNAPQGSCPLSSCVNLFVRLKVPRNDFELLPVTIANKSERFLGLNPSGKVPFLVDNLKETCIEDFEQIFRYLTAEYPGPPDMRTDYFGPAVEAIDTLLYALANLLTCSDPENVPLLQEALSKELRRINNYMKSSARGDKTFLIDDSIKFVDCILIPKLHQVQVAMSWFHGFTISSELSALCEYIRQMESQCVWQVVKPSDDDVIREWARNGAVPFKSNEASQETK